MVYYGPTFLELEGNDVFRVEDYVATMMSEINQGFENTDIPLRADLLCLKFLDMEDNDDQASSRDLVEGFASNFSESKVFIEGCTKTLLIFVVIRICG